MAKWKVNNIPCQDSRNVIITGANSGIGFQMAKVLASRGAKVIMACRNFEKAAKAEMRIRKRYPEADITVMHLDLSSLSSVKDFAEEYKKRYKTLDILINNAGVMASPYRKTEDGFEWQLGVNHLGHFALTGHLIDLIRSTKRSRIVTITSIAHFKGKIHFDDLSGESWYGRMKAYRQSKLANLLFAYELQHRLMESGSGAISLAAHPGISSTSIIWLPFPINILKNLVLMSAYRGSLGAVMASTDSSLNGGEYIGPSLLGQAFGNPVVLKSGPTTYDREVWKQLWEVSENLTGVSYLHIK